jgi:MFS family permease
MNYKKETRKYRTLTFIRYLGDGFFYPFFSLYLSSTLLPESKIGFILSLSPFIGILMNPIFSHFCKDVKKTRICLRTISIIEALIIAFIPFTSDFYLLTALAILMAIFGSCHYGLMDSLNALYCDSAKINYSSIRVFGSSAYIVAPALGGFFCENLGYKFCFILAAIMFLIAGIFYELLIPLDVEFKSKEEKPKYRDLFKNKKFVIFLIFYALVMGNFSSSNSFYGMYLESREVSKEIYGFVYSYFVLFEVVVLILLNKYGRKFSHNKLLLIASISLFLMMFSNYLYLPIPICLILSAFRGLSYGLILHVSYAYIIRIIGEKWATFGIMLCTLFMQIYVVIFNNINGNLIERFSYKAFYFSASIIALLAFIIALARLIIYEKSERELIKIDNSEINN